MVRIGDTGAGDERWRRADAVRGRGTGRAGGCGNCWWATVDRRVVHPAGEAALGWQRVSTRLHHELSGRRGTGPWQGHRVWMEIRMPTPHLGHSLGLPAVSTAS